MARDPQTREELDEIEDTKDDEKLDREPFEQGLMEENESEAGERVRHVD